MTHTGQHEGCLACVFAKGKACKRSRECLAPNGHAGACTSPAEALTRARAMASGWVLAKVRERIGSAQS